MTDKPFFTAEDFECDCPTEKSDKSAYEHLLKKDARKGHYDWCRACDGAWDANAKVAPLIAENERLNDNLDVTNKSMERLVSDIQQLTEQNRLMREALEFYANRTNKHCVVHSFDEFMADKMPHEQYDEKTNSIAHFKVDFGEKAREALAKVSDMEKGDTRRDAIRDSENAGSARLNDH